MTSHCEFSTVKPQRTSTLIQSIEPSLSTICSAPGWKVSPSWHGASFIRKIRVFLRFGCKNAVIKSLQNETRQLYASQIIMMLDAHFITIFAKEIDEKLQKLSSYLVAKWKFVETGWKLFTAALTMHKLANRNDVVYRAWLTALGSNTRSPYTAGGASVLAATKQYHRQLQPLRVLVQISLVCFECGSYQLRATSLKLIWIKLT